MTDKLCGDALIARLAAIATRKSDGGIVLLVTVNCTAMHDQKMRHINRYDMSFQTVSEAIQTDQLRPVAESYSKNMDRVLALGNLPVWLLFHSSIGMRAVIEAHMEIFGNVPPLPGLALATDSPEFIERVHSLVGKYLNAEDERRALLGFSWWNIDELGGGSSGFDEVWQGFSVILTSQIIATWTAFETLAGDLWETAININPRWALLCGKVKESEQTSSKQVSLSKMHRITRGTFDLSAKMGTLHRSGGRFNFTSIDSIREAYAAAFDREFRNIHEPLADQSLDALSAVRNLIVHRAGVADESYLEDIKRVSAAPQLKVGEAIKLDGVTSSGLIGPVVENSVRLLMAVDSRLVAVGAKS